jgi:hypothetical protein
MQLRRVGNLLLILLCSLGQTATSLAGDVDHQVYSATVSQTVQAIRLALQDVGRGVLGADASTGIVVSTTKPVKPADVRAIAEFDEAVEVISLFVVLVTPRGSDASEVEVMTVLRGRSSSKGFVGGGVYLSPTPLSDALYAALDPYLGSGHVRSLDRR